MKAKIRQNIYGNWYGYIGTRKVEWFFGTTTEQEREANEWLQMKQAELNAHRLAEKRARQVKL